LHASWPPERAEQLIWGRWAAANPHALIIAESGSRKTCAMSGLLAQELALGEDALLIPR
jgi:hypothetical protein